MARKATRGIGNGGQRSQAEVCTAAYIRVSTDRQAEEGFSLEAQAAKIRALCQAQGWQLCDHIYVDAGVSGKSTDRPEFQRMLEAAQAGKVGRIVAVKLDRLARNVRDFLAVVDSLQRAGCELVLIREGFDTSTPSGKFALTMFAAMAELEVSMIAERTLAGREQKAREAGFNGARTPYGYDYDAASETFTPNDRAPIVAGIFADYLAGSSLRAIADRLNTDSVPTAAGGKWYASTVSYILRNGLYAGLVQWDGQEATGKHTPIVSLADYERVQAMLNRSEAAKRRAR
jgi:site-specific DNA recombinase